MEPYRVDRDPQAVIPIETLHAEIKSATVCVADITTRNPNVMYELGYAVAAEKDVIIISGPSADKYPFDIQHRGILGYAVGSKSDFEHLGVKVTEKLLATLARQARVENVVSSSPVRTNDSLQPHEFTVLALILANSDAVGDPVAMSWLKQEMRKATFNEIGTRMALAKLTKMGYTEVTWGEDYDNNRYAKYALTDAGENWLLQNQSRLQITTKPATVTKPDYGDNGITDDDIPF